jgi:hypothetical protein
MTVAVAVNLKGRFVVSIRLHLPSATQFLSRELGLHFNECASTLKKLDPALDPYSVG